jgi:hypothetical protein
MEGHLYKISYQLCSVRREEEIASLLFPWKPTAYCCPCIYIRGASGGKYPTVLSQNMPPVQMNTSKRPMKTFPASQNLCGFLMPGHIHRQRNSKEEDYLRAIGLHLNFIQRSEKLLKENSSPTKEKELKSKHLDNLKALELILESRESSMSLKPRL